MTQTTGHRRALPVVYFPLVGDCYVDFKLRELRVVDSPSVSTPFHKLAEATKARVRGIRAEFGPNEYMEGLDD